MCVCVCVCTGAAGVLVLVEEDVVQDEGEQLGLQGVLRRVHQGLQLLPAPRHHLVAEDQQQVAQAGERLLTRTQGERGGGGRVTTRFNHVLGRLYLLCVLACLSLTCSFPAVWTLVG